MKKERYMVFDNEKGVLLPLKQGSGALSEEEVNEKAEKIQMLLKGLIRQAAKEAVREYDRQLKEELQNYEERQQRRWDQMDEHFKRIDECIRLKQDMGKRKKHSIF